MGIGQASGVIAGLAATQKIEPRELDVKKVPETLISYGPLFIGMKKRKSLKKSMQKNVLENI